ncbi:MAG: PspC domain-containing protein [Candidatus Neomarinimicrobiota bacterium]|tara:strand:- start:301 stop:2319 length:2019 start_codon:yes stop_codon:yes gene_type:complete
MNKTININISGTVFNVDEDAYELLYKYLESIKRYFSKIDADGEIVADIESRIAENFLSNISNLNNSISISDVKNVIKVMGTLDDFMEIYEDDKTKENPNTSEEKKTRRLFRNLNDKVIGGVASGIGNYFNVDPLITRIIFITLAFFGGFGLLAYIICWIGIPAGDDLESIIRKRYYRDSDEKVLGGVAMGVANYFGIDVSLVRILFLISIFFGGFGVLIYFILWFITPEATTVGEKMSMKGYSVTLENIEKYVEEKINPEDKEENILMKIILFPFRIAGPILNGFIKLIAPIIKIALSVILFSVSVAIILLIVLLALNQLEFLDQISADVRVNFLVLDGVDLGVIINEIPTVLITTLYINLFLTLILMIMMITKFLFNRQIFGLPGSIVVFFVWLINTTFNGVALPVLIEKWEKDGVIDEWIESGVLDGYDNYQTYTKSFNIKDFEGLRISIPANIVVSESDTYMIKIDASEKEFENLVVEKSSDNVLRIYSERNRWRWNDWKNENKTSIVIEMPNINLLHASGASNTDIEFSSIEDFTIKLSGASDLDINSDISNLIAIVSGASNVDIDGDVTNSNFKISGSSKLDVEGKGENLVLRASGASTFDGRDLYVDIISLIVSGASTAHVNSNDKLNVDASSASSVYHYGSGSIDDFDISSAASFKSRPLRIHEH